MTDKSAAIASALEPIMTKFFNDRDALDRHWGAVIRRREENHRAEVLMLGKLWRAAVAVALADKEQAIAQACASLGVDL